MTNLSQIDGVATQIVQYRITEWIDESDKTMYFLCSVVKQGRVEGETFVYRTHEQMFSWMRLIVGDYPGMRRAG